VRSALPVFAARAIPATHCDGGAAGILIALLVALVAWVGCARRQER
jgi:hypothetical protein